MFDTRQDAKADSTILDNQQGLKQIVPEMFEIWYTNADCLTNKVDELQTRVIDEKVHAIAISEALPKNSIFSVQEQELAIKGYSSVSNFEIANVTNGRGIILYAKDDLIV